MASSLTSCGHYRESRQIKLHGLATSMDEDTGIGTDDGDQKPLTL